MIAVLLAFPPHLKPLVSNHHTPTHCLPQLLRAAMIDSHSDGIATPPMHRLKEKCPKLDVDVCDDAGRTPLMWAAELGHADAAQALLGLGADRQFKDGRFGR